ncbi:MAG: phosphatase PAP2 family protein [Lachnospiraceae bacterium]|nr:phosphatase PAP2 family protein [Lachnospiraceae bacterium]
MDIEYLLALQDLRETIGNGITSVMVFLSHFAVNYLLIFPVLIYWCIDKKKGLYALVSAGINICLNSVIKLTACVYRPWIKDARIIPAEKALKESTGYSFPSGHATTATSLYGGMAVGYGKKYKWLAAILILLLVITGFSRNYLGVHTPQDVVIGHLLGIAGLFGIYMLFKFLDKHPEKEDIFLIIGIAFGIGALLYISFKSYPIDYDAEGTLLVDPVKMKIDGYKDIGMFLAMCIGRFIENHFIKFSSAGLNLKGILLSVAGLVPLIIIAKVLPSILIKLLGDTVGPMSGQMLIALYIIAGWPIIIKLVCGKNKESIAKETLG